MTRIILVRHGQTEWNRVERFRGRTELALNETGVSQAEATAERLAGWPVAAVYYSPLKRALDTARIICLRLALTPEPLEGLIDIDYGQWQGLSPEEAAARDSHLYDQWLNSPHLVRFPGGEGLEEVRLRATAAFDQACAQHPEQTVVLVSHVVVCRVLICSLLGLDNSHFWRVGQDVSAINIFEVRDGLPAATLINDTCHLKKLGL